MDWEGRSRSNNKYLCRSIRVDGRVSKQYVGPSSEVVVKLVAQGDALSNSEAAAAVDQVRCEQVEFKQLEALLAASEERVSAAIEASTENRWAMDGNRRRKTSLTRDTEPMTRELLDHLVSQANRGDQNAALELRRMLRRHPGIWQRVGDLGKHVEGCLIDLIAAGNVLLRESLKLKSEELRASLSEPSDNALAKLMVDHVVSGWLECQLARMAAAQPQQHKRDARFWQERYERAEARHLASIEKLADVRTMLAAGRDEVTTSKSATGVSSD